MSKLNNLLKYQITQAFAKPLESCKNSVAKQYKTYYFTQEKNVSVQKYEYVIKL